MATLIWSCIRRLCFVYRITYICSMPSSSNAPSFTLELFALRLDTCMRSVCAIINFRTIGKIRNLYVYGAVEYLWLWLCVYFRHIKTLIHKHVMIHPCDKMQNIYLSPSYLSADLFRCEFNTVIFSKDCHVSNCTSHHSTASLEPSLIRQLCLCLIFFFSLSFSRCDGMWVLL